MNVEIGGLGPVRPPESPQTTVKRGSGEFAAALRAANDSAVRVDLDPSFPTSPPPEVSQAIVSASRAYDVLSAGGQRVHFALDRPTGSLTVQLHDLDGNPFSTLSASDALRIADAHGLT